MAEATPDPRFWRAGSLVLGILGLLALAGPADASSCHAPDRPTFGLDVSPIGPRHSSAFDPALTFPAPPHYDEAPCPGDSAGFPAKFPIPRAHLSASIPIEPAEPTGPRWPEFASARTLLADSGPLERPPRDPSSLVSN